MTLTIDQRRERVATLLQATHATPRRTRIHNAAGTKTAVIYLYGAISRYAGWFEDTVSARDFAKSINALDVDRIELHVHSPGGDVFEAVAIHNAIRNHKAEVVAWVDGLAASAASFIILAADEIVMGPGSQLMIHDASMLTWGNAEELQADADWLDAQSQNIAGLYADRAGGDADAWRALMKDETWFTADEAVKAGLAERIAPKKGTAEAPASVDTPGDEADADEIWDMARQMYGALPGAPAARHRATHKPPAATAAGSTPTTEGGGLMTVQLTDDQANTARQQLGLPEDADGATIVAALSEALEEQEPTSTPTAQVPDGMRLIEDGVLNQLRADAQAGRTALDRQRNDDRERTLDNAVSSGRITPARREHFAKLYDADPEGTVELLDSLEPGVSVPVDELGHAKDTSASSTVTDVREDDDYKNWSM